MFWAIILPTLGVQERTLSPSPCPWCDRQPTGLAKGSEMFWVKGLRFRVEGLRFRVEGLGFKVSRSLLLDPHDFHTSLRLPEKSEPRPV